MEQVIFAVNVSASFSGPLVKLSRINANRHW